MLLKKARVFSKFTLFPDIRLQADPIDPTYRYSTIVMATITNQGDPLICLQTNNDGLVSHECLQPSGQFAITIANVRDYLGSLDSTSKSPVKVEVPADVRSLLDLARSQFTGVTDGWTEIDCRGEVTWIDAKRETEDGKWETVDRWSAVRTSYGWELQ